MMDVENIEDLGVFQIFTGAGTGSGFLVSETHLVTNCHVVAPYHTVAVELRDKTRIRARVRRIHPKRDLAIVELERPLEAQILGLSDLDELRAKQPINILGFPVGLPLSVTEGVVSHPKQLLDGQHFVQTDAAVNPGNSGGPMVDEARQIVAVTTCKLRGADLVGFGIPGSDVKRFVAAFAEQSAPFGVECPACELLLESADRYCDGCGSDLEYLDLGSYFEEPEPHPVVGFAEQALRHAGIDPVLARHGDQNWSFFSGSAPIRIWCCCSEHLTFSSPLAQPGKQGISELFRFLLGEQHAPYAFDLDGNLIRLNLTVHMSDVFAPSEHPDLFEIVKTFVSSANSFDSRLIAEFGCEPAPETRLAFLKSAGPSSTDGRSVPPPA